MVKSEFDALPIGAKMQCQYSSNIYEKTGTNEFVCIEASRNPGLKIEPYVFSFHWVNQPDGYWASLVVYSEA